MGSSTSTLRFTFTALLALGAVQTADAATSTVNTDAGNPLIQAAINQGHTLHTEVGCDAPTAGDLAQSECQAMANEAGVAMHAGNWSWSPTGCLTDLYRNDFFFNTASQGSNVNSNYLSMCETEVVGYANDAERNAAITQNAGEFGFSLVGEGDLAPGCADDALLYEEECQDLADSLDGVGMATGSWGWAPKGCLWNTKHDGVWFNTHATGSNGNTNYTSVCAEDTANEVQDDYTVTFHWLPYSSGSTDNLKALDSRCDVASINDFLSLGGEEIPADWDQTCKSGGSDCWRELNTKLDRVGPRYWFLNNETLAFRDADGEMVGFYMLAPYYNWSGQTIKAYTATDAKPGVVACKTPVMTGASETPIANPPPSTAKRVIFQSVRSSEECELAHINDFLSLNGADIPATWDKVAKDEVANGYATPPGSWRTMRVRSGIADANIFTLAKSYTANLEFQDADGQVVNFPIGPLPSNLADGNSISMLTQDGSSPATYRACKAE